MRGAMMLAAAMASAGPAAAAMPQTGAAQPGQGEPEIYSPGIRIRQPDQPLPAKEALALGQRLAAAALEPEISAQVQALLAEADREARAADPDAPIVARSPLEAREIRRRDAVNRILLERFGLIYARQFTVEELRQMVAFFESGAGGKFTDQRPGIARQIDALLQWPAFRADVRQALCMAEPRRLQAAAPACRGMEPEGSAPADPAALGRRLASAGIFDGVFGIAGAAEVERIAEQARGLGAGERRWLRDIGTRQLAAARERLIAQAEALYARHYSADELRAIVSFFESPEGEIYKRPFASLVPDLAWAVAHAGFGAKLPPSLARLAAKAPENWPDTRIPEFREGAQEASRRLAEISDFTVLILALDPAIREAAARKRVIDRIGGRYFAAYEWARVPVWAPLPGDLTDQYALELFVQFFESPAGRAYTAALPALLPELTGLVRAENVAAATRAEFCRETGKLCRR